MGKAYANRKPIEERPESDNYPTPIPAVIELANTGILKKNVKYHDPCAGDRQLVNTMNRLGFMCTGSDIRDENPVDFLEDFTRRECILTNAPFSDFDNIINHAQEVAPIVISIGKTNFFGAHGRNINGFWKHLKHVYVFDRQIEYRTPIGSMEMNIGMLTSGWFLFDRRWNKPFWQMSLLDVNKYCTLGPIEKRVPKKKKAT